MAYDIDELSNVLVGELTKRLRPLLQEAYDAGRNVGRQEAANEVRAKLAAALGPIEVEATASVQKGTPSSDQSQRAAPGSVKPRILALVREIPGLSAKDIEVRTGIKYNSVRGTLWALGTENQVQRKNGRWYPAKIEAASGNPAQETLAASDQEPRQQGREAGPGGGT